MTATTRIHDLLDLPARIHKGDFVQSLAESIGDPEDTVRKYAITDGIVQSFRHALSMVDSAIKTGGSQAAFLHGSFGSGKSHLMAILNLMLDNHSAPWERAEFHVLRDEFDWVGRKRFVQLPMHFLDASSIEARVFDSYLRWLADNHPDAPLPGLFQDTELFNNAVQMRKTMGDAAFFKALNKMPTAAAGWGKLAEQGWDAESFEAARTSSDAKQRQRLFNALVKTLFSAFAKETSRYLDLDSGLQVLSEHAKELGYHSVVLYMDELILWLASSSSNLELIQRETQKLVKLREGQHQQRAIPIVSFIARQRDLAQLVGEHARGDQQASLEDSLSHHTDRFEEVRLMDSNLPTIVKHRVLKAKSEAAEAELTAGAQRAWYAAGQARSILIGSADEEAFRLVYPFSPALVEAMVALSECLQRERTAIRILMELLVEHLHDLPLGPVVPVGDVFDVIAGGEEPFDQVIRDRFERARKLYQDHFLPMIRHNQGTASPDKCQRMRKDHPARLGCSACPMTACRTDNRLAKTLLLAALVPQAEPFKDLTVHKLVHLNHGTIASPIPGNEFNSTAAKLRDWSADVARMRVGDQADPTVSLQLDGVDLQPIIANARNHDTEPMRRSRLRDLLFESLGLPTTDNKVDHTHTYHGIKRVGLVRFSNVRLMGDSQLRCPSDMDWHLILDYPFDEGSHGPADDLAHIENYRQNNRTETDNTLIWLPTFFSKDMTKTLGDYVMLEAILASDQDHYLGHLRPEDQVQARGDLRSLRDQKRQQIKQALKAAYGLTAKTQTNKMLDPSLAVEEHVISLAGTFQVPSLLAGTLADGMTQALNRLHEKRYPHHPRFLNTVTANKLKAVQATLQRLIESKDRSCFCSGQEHKHMIQISDPLGLTQTTEQKVLLLSDRFQAIDQQVMQQGLNAPTVAELRHFTDPNNHCGLPLNVQDLLVWAYGEWSGRTMRWQGRDLEAGELGKFPADAEWIRPPLPNDEDWKQARDLMARIFGITDSRHFLNARNLQSFCRQVKDRAANMPDLQSLPDLLAQQYQLWSVAEPAPRLTTARSAVNLMRIIHSHDGVDLVNQLAQFQAQTSETAVSRCLENGRSLVDDLNPEAHHWFILGRVRDLVDHPEARERARTIMERLHDLLRKDEITEPFSEQLHQLVSAAKQFSQPAPPQAARPEPPAVASLAMQKPPVRQAQLLTSRQVEATDPTSFAAQLRTLADDLTKAAADIPSGKLVLKVNAELWQHDQEDS